jgi:hypothetical protein
MSQVVVMSGGRSRRTVLDMRDKLRVVLRRVVKLAVAFGLIIALVVAVANAVVLLGAGESVAAGHERSAPHAQIALVLGALV